MMENKPAGRKAFALKSAGFFCYFAALLILALCLATVADGVWFGLQTRFGVTQESSGIDGETMRMLDRALRDYMAGNDDALNVTCDVFGQRQIAFNDREIQHMKDVQALVQLGWRVCAIMLALGIGLISAGHKAGDKRLVKPALTAIGVLAALLCALVVWACIDFTSLFIAFHHLLFSNLLWYLDPRTDLLIRICPEAMFAAIAGMIAALWVLLCALSFAVAAVLERKEKA